MTLLYSPAMIRYKTAISLKSLADFLSSCSIRYLQDPEERELYFRDVAVALGMDGTRFLFEATALELFTVLTSIKTRKPTKGFSANQADDLSQYTIELHVEKFQHQLPPNIECDLELLVWEDSPSREAFDVMFDRLEEYDTPENFTEANVRVPKLFVKLCGVPDPNGVLLRIGRAIFIDGGSSYVRILKKQKITPLKPDTSGLGDKIASLATGLRAKGHKIPNRVSEIPRFPCPNFDALRTALFRNKLVLFRPSFNYSFDVFKLMAHRSESAVFRVSLVLMYVLPVITLVLTIFAHWYWVLLCPLLIYAGWKLGRSAYLKAIFRSAAESEMKFCFLFYAHAVGVAPPDFSTEYLWHD